MSNQTDHDQSSNHRDEKEKDRYRIQIDRVHYTVEQDTMTGVELRALVGPPIGADRDLFEVVPGGTDRKVEDADTVRMRDGLRFFSAPAHINPGQPLCRFLQ